MRARLAALLLAAGCSREARGGVLFAVSTSLVVCDYHQTAVSSNYGAWDRRSPLDPSLTLREANPLLGSRPSMGLLTTATVLSVAGLAAVSFSELPEWVKALVVAPVIAVESYFVVTNNFFGGVCNSGGT